MAINVHGSIILILSLAFRAHAGCFFPDGSIAQNDVPCQDSSTNSACCGQGYACLSNGICQATGNELKKPRATEFVRGSCTDKTWRSSACPGFCSNPKVDNVGGGAGISKCPNTNEDLYFCINIENINGTNCQTGQNLLFFPGTPHAITTIGVTPTTTSQTTSQTSSSSTTTASIAQDTLPSTKPPTPTAIAQPPLSSSSDSSNGTIIGGAVGGAVGGIALILLFAWLLLRNRRRRNETTQIGVGTGTPFLGEEVMLYEVPASKAFTRPPAMIIKKDAQPCIPQELPA